MLRYVVHSTLFYLTQVQVQEIVYFVAHCVFVELDLFLFVVPFKYYIVEFFLNL